MMVTLGKAGHVLQQLMQYFEFNYFDNDGIFMIIKVGTYEEANISLK